MTRLALLALPALALVACSNPADDSTPDHPGEALRWRALRWQDESGAIPIDGWLRALRQRAAVVAATDALDQGGVAPEAWTERGPFNVAGRSRTIVIDPRDTRRIWSGGVSGGLWRSDDRGITWNAVDDWWTNLAIACLTMDPSDPDTMYAGTGEGFINDGVFRGVNTSSVRGVGMFKTVDGGSTWTHLPSTAGWPYTQRIAVSPTDPNVVLASIRPGGIQRSTDGGQTWVQVHGSFASYQVLFDPNDATKAVAHVVDATLANHGVVHSIDSGVTWTPAVSGLALQTGADARIELCYAAGSPNVVYASCGANGGLVWRSADGGSNWVQRTTSGQSAANWYYNCLWVDPTDENVMVVGAFHVWRSTDGGRVLTRITAGYIMTTDPHLDVHLVVEDPAYDGTTNRRVYVATDGGLHVADDILAAARNRGWRDLDATCRSTQFYGVDADGPSGLIVGGTQDNGTQRLAAGSNQSTMTFGGDGGIVQIDPSNPRYVYGEYVTLQVFRSTNGGSSARFVYSGITDAASRNANFIAPLVLDPNDPRRLYGGAASLWRTDDARASSIAWRAVKPSVGSYVSAIAVAPGDPDLVLVAHNDGRLFRTTNATAATPTWSALDDNVTLDPLPDRYVSCLAIDTVDHRIAWATFGGFMPDNVWVTRDGGAVWTPLPGAAPYHLPDAPVNWIARHPDDRQVLYAATEVGIFASDDGGAHWSASNDGPANVAVEQVRFAHGSRTLVAATLGRGLWTADVRRPTSSGFGSGCAGAGSSPTLATDPQSLARIGRPTRWTLTGASPGGSAHLLVGFSRSSWPGGTLPFDLGAVGMPGCWLLVRPEFAFSTSANATGDASWSLDIPDDPGLLGATFHAQALTDAPGANPLGLLTSAARSETIGW